MVKRISHEARGVRWDAAVGEDGFWTSAPARSHAPEPATASGARDGLAVEVRLFGMLSAAQGPRSIDLRLPDPSTLADVLVEVRRCLGPAGARSLIGANGAPERCCRVFVNGVQAEDPTAPLQQDGGSAAVEIILVIAAEGG